MAPDEQGSIKAVEGEREPVRDDDRILLVLSYLSVFALIPLLTSDSTYVKWHAKNGLVLSLGVPVALSIVLFVLSLIPFVRFIPCLLSCLPWLVWMVIDVVAIMKALQGVRWRVPLVTDIAEQL